MGHSVSKSRLKENYGMNASMEKKDHINFTTPLLRKAVWGEARNLIDDGCELICLLISFPFRLWHTGKNRLAEAVASWARYVHSGRTEFGVTCLHTQGLATRTDKNQRPRSKMESSWIWGGHRHADTRPEMHGWIVLSRGHSVALEQNILVRGGSVHGKHLAGDSPRKALHFRDRSLHSEKAPVSPGA